LSDFNASKIIEKYEDLTQLRVRVRVRVRV